ncbi:hypothetical protein BH09ACT7_BH09ACT7_05030 [soil metagenome]
MSGEPTDDVLLVGISWDGPSFSPEALSLLTGVPADEIRAAGISTIEGLPLEWIQAGRRRSAEAAAITGTEDTMTTFRYWASKDRNVELILRDGGLYMPAEGMKVPDDGRGAAPDEK